MKPKMPQPKEKIMKNSNLIMKLKMLSVYFGNYVTYMIYDNNNASEVRLEIKRNVFFEK